MEERIQKILSRFGVCSRRQAEDLICQGRIEINGRLITALGAKADTACDVVLVDGNPLPQSTPLLYVMLNKPKGFLTTLRDPHGRPTISDLLKGIPVRVYPVGRLDYDTEGLLFLTNDGELSCRLQHPRSKVAKVYRAEVKGHPSPGRLERLEKGIMIEGRRTLPALIKLARRERDSSILEIQIREGRKRQIRKMCKAIGHPVLNLKRTAIANISLGDLPPGQYRYLEREEVESLKEFTEQRE